MLKSSIFRVRHWRSVCWSCCWCSGDLRLRSGCLVSFVCNATVQEAAWVRGFGFLGFGFRLQPPLASHCRLSDLQRQPLQQAFDASFPRGLGQSPECIILKRKLLFSYCFRSRQAAAQNSRPLVIISQRAARCYLPACHPRLAQGGPIHPKCCLHPHRASPRLTGAHVARTSLSRASVLPRTFAVSLFADDTTLECLLRDQSSFIHVYMRGSRARRETATFSDFLNGACARLLLAATLLSFVSH